MSLFIVRHQHTAESCPARNPQLGPRLLQHLTAANAQQFGVTIRGEGIAENAHTLYLILDARSRDHLERFMQPFAQAGTVEIMPATTCEAVVERGGCDVSD